ncbi:MAG: HlyD family efflux transporter periplasmic adaptor subunit [Anaerovorax sp.]
MKKKRLGVTVFFIAAVALFAAIYVVPSITGILQKTEIIEYGGLQVTDKVTCYFVREEFVYLAEQAGAVSYYIEQGQEMRKNVRILDVVPNVDAGGSTIYPSIFETANAFGVPFGEPQPNYVSQINGSISYFVDGFEAALTPETMKTISRESLDDKKIEVQNVVRDHTVTGDPLYKMIDDNEWYVMYWTPAENIVKYEKGNEITLKLPKGEVVGKVFDIIDEGDTFRIILSFNRYYEDFDSLRKIEAEVVTSNKTGLIVSNKSIKSENGQPGVYVKDVTGAFVFKPVKILSTNGVYSTVESSYFYTDGGTKRVETVNVYDEIQK